MQEQEQNGKGIPMNMYCKVISFVSSVSVPLGGDYHSSYGPV
jgi:hypothetical protein